ncbi:MAG TPA: hypothetical protein VKR31_07390 [Rhizomicrobium sp.]|nr:hypothetical protein [Rhizomicrobium sp.]
MRVFAALLFSSAVVLAPALAAAQATTAPVAQAGQATAAPAPTAPATSDNSSANLDEIVCKSSPPPTGSRLGGGRECHTVRQWNEREREAQDITRQQELTGYNRPGG